ncbi:unnamed protein product [Candidula unifasciata]|uniref:Uncharacterized protein n=1 Tax=Candidula unifasciata TaxID=100452 RepID=A0A8S3ZLR3_9EUPU|nr:unnamed protein product [Candidula unifasciata]
MSDGCPCTSVVYHEPTPMWYHSYGLDYAGNLRRSSQLATTRETVLTNLIPEAPQLWELQEQVEPQVTVGRCVMDVSDPTHHSWPYQTVTSSQAIGWFADPKRLPKCRLREWPKHLRFV